MIHRQAIPQSTTAKMKNILKMLGSKTVLGSVLMAGAYVYNQGQTTGVISPADWFTALGGVISAIGVKHAISKGPTDPTAK